MNTAPPEPLATQQIVTLGVPLELSMTFRFELPLSPAPSLCALRRAQILEILCALAYSASATVVILGALAQRSGYEVIDHERFFHSSVSGVGFPVWLKGHK